MAAFISETCVNILFSLYSIPTAQPDSDFIDILLPIHKDIWKTQLNSDKNSMYKYCPIETLGKKIQFKLRKKEP